MGGSSDIICHMMAMAVMYISVFIGGGCIRVRQHKSETNKQNPILSLLRSHAITGSWKFLGFEKKYPFFPKPRADIVHNFSKEARDAVRTTPAIGDGYYDLIG